MNEFVKVYAEFANGDRKTFTDVNEENAMCDATYYAEEHNTEITYYTTCEE